MTNFDDRHGETPVATLQIVLLRNGCMGVAGSITDEMYAMHLLNTAIDTVKTYHAKRRIGERSSLIVPAHDTSLVGTAEEKKLLQARHELADAMAGVV